MAEQKTKPTAVSVADYIKAVPDPVRRKDAETVSRLMQRITGEKPKLWGASLIGFGRYTYGKKNELESLRIGFSPRKTELVVYLLPGYEEKKAELAKLGKHRIGKSCLYLKSLADVDMTVFEGLVQDAWAEMNRRYPPA